MVQAGVLLCEGCRKKMGDVFFVEEDTKERHGPFCNDCARKAEPEIQRFIRERDAAAAADAGYDGEEEGDGAGENGERPRKAGTPGPPGRVLAG
jgi:hypothetical protein